MYGSTLFSLPYRIQVALMYVERYQVRIQDTDDSSRRQNFKMCPILRILTRCDTAMGQTLWSEMFDARRGSFATLKKVSVIDHL